MNGIKDLDQLLERLDPKLSVEEYVFCSFKSAEYGDHRELNPIGTFQEDEGLTLVIGKEMAVQNGLDFSSVYRRITLQVHSSLDAVGLTASVATRLSESGISANVVAAYYHDHIFVPSAQADSAMAALQELQSAL